MFSIKLKELIDENKMSVEDLSNALKLNNSSLIYRWLKDIHMPSLTMANTLVNIFECSYDFLFGEENEFVIRKKQNSKLFGNRLREVLTKMNVSQQSIIKNLHISPTSITKWLNNSSIPNMVSVIKLANYLNVSIDYLVGRD